MNQTNIYVNGCFKAYAKQVIKMPKKVNVIDSKIMKGK